MKKIILLFSMIGICFQAVSQHEADKWYFGVLASVNFTSGTPVAGSGALNTSEGCASISNSSGGLYFYTDGVSVWDNTNTVMPNGTGLTGDVSSTQSAVIVPNPAVASQYYIFTTAADGGAAGFRYTLVDMALHGGLGDVMTTDKNVPLVDSSAEKVAAVRDGSNGYWIVMHKWGSNKFYSYHLTAAGLSAPVISSIGIVYTTAQIQNTYGQLKFNMCGDKLVAATGYLNTVEVFDFDLSSGVVSNPLTIPMSHPVYGVEFSKSSQLLYVTCYDVSATLSQFDISSGNLSLVLASKTPLTVTSDLYALQMGPDGKIYVAIAFNQYLGVINSPETAGSGCNYVDNGLNLDPSSMGITGGIGLPEFMQSYLRSGVTCTVATGITENAAASESPVFPNPSADEFAFQMNSSKQSDLTIYDYAGKKVEEYSGTTSVIHFGKSYVPGIYILVYRNDNQTKTYKVVKM